MYEYPPHRWSNLPVHPNIIRVFIVIVVFADTARPPTL